MAKRALITGVAGQDGSYLAKLLLEKGYEVYGAYRRSASADFSRLAELGVDKDVVRKPFELLEPLSILRLIEETKPDEVYNLAAQSFVSLSFEQPVYTAEADALGVTRLLECIRTANPKIRFYQASTSEMFGKPTEVPQTENTRFYPRSPYGVAKVYAHMITVNYRESYGMHCTSGILFNHESPLRGLEFVTRKISASLARVKLGQQEVLELGNLEAKRDWGFAGDYVDGMWRMLQRDIPEDYILATGQLRSVGDFFTTAAIAAGFEPEFVGAGKDLTAIDRKTGQTILRTNPDFYRPAEVDSTVGDASKAARDLGWVPQTSFEDMVGMMVEKDLERASKGILRI